MASICGVCNTQPSKYKCSKCELPYCSLACYKPHKATHSDEDVKQPIAEPVKEATHVEETEPAAAPASSSSVPASGRNGRGPKKPDFSSLSSDPDLIRLMTRYPGLRIQLQHIYSFTLEPDPQDQRNSYDNNGRGRGRGRGGRGRGFRGQRGGYGNNQPQRPSQWTQAKGDKEAADMFKRMRDREGEEEGLAEFVQLINMKFGSGREE